MQRLTNILGLTIHNTVRNTGTGFIAQNPSNAFLEPNTYLFLRITEGVLFNRLDHIALMQLRLLIAFRNAGSRIRIREITNNVSAGIDLNTTVNVGNVIVDYLIPSQPERYTTEIDLTELAVRWRGNSNESRAIRIEVTGSALVILSTFLLLIK